MFFLPVNYSDQSSGGPNRKHIISAIGRFCVPSWEGRMQRAENSKPRWTERANIRYEKKNEYPQRCRLRGTWTVWDDVYFQLRRKSNHLTTVQIRQHSWTNGQRGTVKYHVHKRNVSFLSEGKNHPTNSPFPARTTTISSSSRAFGFQVAETSTKVNGQEKWGLGDPC